MIKKWAAKTANQAIEIFAALLMRSAIRPLMFGSWNRNTGNCGESGVRLPKSSSTRKAQ